MKLDSYHIKKILGYIGEGLNKTDACDAARVSRGTFYTWLKQGKEDAEKGAESLQRALYEGIPGAEAEFELQHLRRITAASKSDWHASAWYLERYRGRVRPQHIPDLDDSKQPDEVVEIG
jgi:transposase